MSSLRSRRSRLHAAPLSGTAIAGGVALCALLWGLALALPWILPARERFGVLPVSLILALTPVVTGLYLVCGYEVEPGRLVIRRPSWRTVVPLQNLQEVRVDPQAMRRAWKIAGNSGFFAWVGWFRNKRLGSFRAWVTDQARAVVLVFPDRPRVVSPEKPRAFAEDVIRAAGLPESALTQT